MLAPPEREDFSRRSGDSLRFEPAFLRAARTSAQRWLLLCHRAYTRSRGKKPHTAATRGSRRGAGAWRTRRGDSANYFHGRKIGTFGTFEGNPPFAVAAVRLC